MNTPAVMRGNVWTYNGLNENKDYFSRRFAPYFHFHFHMPYTHSLTQINGREDKCFLIFL